MAQAGFTPISLYFSSTAAAVPTSGNLANGELALNIADMKLYAKNSAGTVTLLASNAGASGSVTSVAATVPTFLSITGSPITTSGTLAISLSGTALPTTSGGTGLTSFTSGGVVYASSTSALTTSSAFTWNGNTLAITGGNVGISASTGNLFLDGAAGASVNLRVSGYTASVQVLSTSAISFNTASAQRFVFGTSGQFGIGATPDYGSAGQVLTSGGSGAAPTWTTNGAGTVTSITVAAGTGMSGGGTVTTSGTVTLTNAGVTSIVAGTGITISGATGAVTVNASGGSSFSVKTANYTAVSGDSILANTSGGSFTITLPASPSTGSTVYIQDSANSFLAFPLTVARNGQTIMGLSEDTIASQNGIGFGLTYNGTTWRIY